MKFYVTGDKHGHFDWILENEIVRDPDNAIIILGDAGLNYYLNSRDDKLKKHISDNSSCRWYIVRGNHEARPLDAGWYGLDRDEDVGGVVLSQEEYPNIRFFLDYGEYHINGYDVAVIGGAYSVDKWYRLYNAGVFSKTDWGYNNPKKTGWFPNEQLSGWEMSEAEKLFSGKIYDFVLSHTCPLSFQPTDLFLSGIDQNAVDSTMEHWMEGLKDKMSWGVWLWAHYHTDRIERPHCEIFYHDIESLEDIFNRWENYDETKELPWYLIKSPNFYMI